MLTYSHRSSYQIHTAMGDLADLINILCRANKELCRFSRLGHYIAIASDLYHGLSMICTEDPVEVLSQILGGIARAATNIKQYFIPASCRLVILENKVI